MSATKLTSAGLMDVINDIERRFPVADWTVDGVRIWPMVRVRWFFAIWGAAYGDSSRTAGRVARLIRHFAGIARGRLDAARARLRDRAAEDRTDQARQVVFLSDGVSFVENAGRQYERYCDPIVERLRARGISALMLTPSHRYRTPRTTPSVFVQPALDVANLRGARHARRLAGRSSLPQNDAVRAALAAAGCDHPSLTPAKLTIDTGRVTEVADFYGGVLDRVQPRLAFIVSYYSVDGAAFALACRRRSIPLVDLQHGVQGPLHPAYGRMPSPPRGGFELVPDRFWVWSREEADAIAEWGAGEGTHQAVIGGNMWLDRWLKSDEGQMRDVDARVRELRARASSARVVLVTLQWGLSEEEQMGPLVELIRAAAAGWVWWVRLHPVMREERAGIRARLCAAGRSDAVVVDEPSDLPLYGILRHVDVHLTHSSSTVIEALEFGVRSVVTSRYGSEVYPKQMANGDVVLAEGGADDVLTALDRQAAHRRVPELSSDLASAALDGLLRESGLAAEAPQ